MGAATVGALAACMTTGAWIPQLVRTWRSRSAHDLSRTYLTTTLLGVTLCLGKAISDRRSGRG